MSEKNQIKKLEDFILKNYPEYIIDGGAGDVAIEIIKDLQSKNEIIKELIWQTIRE